MGVDPMRRKASPELALMSFTITVPAAVPSDLQSSRPWTPSKAVK
jgi:hypothetical protein